MIVFLNGTLIEKQPTRAVVEVAGVGYEVLIPLSSYDRLPATGHPVRILTHDYVREDARLLYGFMTPAERDMFAMLLGATGIGPKLALSALSGLTVRELKAAFVEGDIKRLSAISGIGKKMAERLIVELRHKISDADALDAVAGADDKTAGGTLLRDALLALITLGYKQDEARKMVRQVTETHPTLSTVEDIVKRAVAR
jgi:holliday junction DNA helicase RuvA